MKFPCRRERRRRLSRLGAAASLPCRPAALARRQRSMIESYQGLKLDVADFVATVRLACPPVNAQNRQLREEIIAVFDALNDRNDVRAVVLTGEGKTFSAGADLKERPGLSEEVGAYPRHNRIVRESFNAVMECEKPVI